jgi:predicted nucleotidyltransferase component of viral defense system
MPESTAISRQLHHVRGHDRTAINLFIRDMPRLSVDIDLVYVHWDVPREEALQAINDEIAAIAGRIKAAGIGARPVGSKDLGNMKLIAEDDTAQVKIEVNAIFRGTVLPVEKRPLTKKTSDMFSFELDLPVLGSDEIYAGKLVAALDRQHPRDLFDVWQLFETDGLTDNMVECFVTYIAGHNRPIHEVLFGNDKNIASDYKTSFVGMTNTPCALDTLLNARVRLRAELPRRLTDRHRNFLIGLAQGDPDWSRLKCKHASELPALKWKLENLQTFKKRRPVNFEEQVDALKARFDALGPVP